MSNVHMSHKVLIDYIYWYEWKKMWLLESSWETLYSMCQWTSTSESLSPHTFESELRTKLNLNFDTCFQMNNPKYIFEINNNWFSWYFQVIGLSHYHVNRSKMLLHININHWKDCLICVVKTLRFFLLKCEIYLLCGVVNV